MLSASSQQTHGLVVSLILQPGKRRDIHQLHVQLATGHSTHLPLCCRRLPFPRGSLGLFGLLLLQVFQRRHHVCAERGRLCPTALLCLGGEGPTSCAKLSLAITAPSSVVPAPAHHTGRP